MLREEEDAGSPTSGSKDHKALPSPRVSEPRALDPSDDHPAADAKSRPPAEAEKGDDESGGLGAFVARHKRGVVIAVIVAIVAIALGTLWYLQARHWETTDDAFVDGRSFAVAPKVGGYVVEVLVTDNQHVAAGDRIALIDDRDYRVAVEQAEGQVAAATANVQGAVAQIASQRAQVEEARARVVQTEASLSFAKEESDRAADLVQKGAGTLQRAQQTGSQQREAEANLTSAKAALNAAERQIAVLVAQRASAEASLAQAKAQLDQAQLNLSYAVVTAAQPGRVVRLTGAKGQLAQAGQAIAMFVPDELWVTANFKETQLTDMRPGQEVEMTIDAYPGQTLRGHVDSVQAGSGTAFSLLPAQNATGNYVKVVQRVPVKLVFDDLPKDVTIGPGMSVVPKVKVR